jgi:hypothetical protein
MTRAILILTMLLPAAVLAQENSVAPQVSAEASTSVAVGQAATPSPQRTAPASPAAPGAKRRPSMVGYIDDGTIQSQVRIRFDTAFQNDLPDRAEFFYAKCGCYQGLAQAIPQAFDPNAPGPGPGVPKSLNFQQLYLDAEYAPNSRFSVFAEIPARWIQPQSFLPIPPFAPFASQSGLSDIRAGVKLGIVSSSTSSLTVQLRGYFPTGNASKGLGTNHATFEPALLYNQQLSDRLTLESQLGDWHPLGGSIGVPSASTDKFSGDVFFYGIGPSYEVYRNNTLRFAPVVELVGWNVRGGFQTQPGGPVLGAAADASGTNIVNLKIGGRLVVRDRSSFYIGYGHALTNSAWYQNIVRLEYRSSF